MTLRAGERDALGTAVLASILLHLALLSALPGWREWQRSPAPVPIIARVVAEPVRAALPPQATPSPERRSPPKRSEPQREEASAREGLTSAADAPGPAQDSSTSTPEPSTSVAVATAPRSEPSSPPPAADTGTLAQYRLAIISLAKGFNRYPRIAVENNWQGRAEVRVTLGTDGTIASLGLRSGSGHEILDRQALDMIGRAAPQVALPAALRGREIAVDIPVIFSLKEAER